MTSNTGCRIIGMSVNNNATTDKIMTITTDAATETTTTTVSITPFDGMPDFRMGVVRNNIISDGGTVFLGVEGQHGTAFRLTTNREKIVMANILECMAEELRAGVEMSRRREAIKASKLQEEAK